MSGTHVTSDVRTLGLYRHIHNGLMLALQNEIDLIAELLDKCTANNGVHEVMYLQSKFDGNSSARTVKIIKHMVEGNLGIQSIAGANNMLSMAGSLPSTMVLPDQFLSALIVSKLPPSLAVLKSIILEKNDFPSTTELLEKIERAEQFGEDPTPMAFATFKPCFNCGSKDHPRHQCPKDRVDCDVCGERAGHLPEYCLVKNDKPYPSSFSAEQRAALDKKRAEYRANRPSTNIIMDRVNEMSVAQVTSLVEAVEGGADPYECLGITV